VAKKEYRQELIEQKEKELKLLDDKRKMLEEDVKKLKSG
jgi:cell division protein FtsB